MCKSQNIHNSYVYYYLIKYFLKLVLVKCLGPQGSTVHNSIIAKYWALHQLCHFLKVCVSRKIENVCVSRKILIYVCKSQNSPS